MHIKFIDLDGDLHFPPKEKMYLRSCADAEEFEVVILQDNVDNIEIDRDEFERLVILFDRINNYGSPETIK